MENIISWIPRRCYTFFISFFELKFIIENYSEGYHCLAAVPQCAQAMAMPIVLHIMRDFAAKWKTWQNSKIKIRRGRGREREEKSGNNSNASTFYR